MDAFNRLVVSALLAVVAWLGLAATAVTAGLVSTEDALFVSKLGVDMSFLDPLYGWQNLVAGAACFVVAAVAVILIVMQWRPKPASRRPFLVGESELGMLTLERLSVCHLVERVLLDVPGVRTVKASVSNGKEGVVVDCRVVTDPAAVLPDVGPEVQELAKESIEQQLGLPVEKVSARLRLFSGKSARPIVH